MGGIKIRAIKQSPHLIQFVEAQKPELWNVWTPEMQDAEIEFETEHTALELMPLYRKSSIKRWKPK